MARHNVAFLYGSVVMSPRITYREIEENGEMKRIPRHVMMFINVMRGYRNAHDGTNYSKLDRVCLMTGNEAIINQFEQYDFQQNDIVMVKGFVATINTPKTSHCTHEDCLGKNADRGVFVYVSPIFIERYGHGETKSDCMEFIARKREVSNQILTIGTVCREPKKIKVKTRNNLVITQYPLALNRKFWEKSDPPEKTTDYPWVKSYGENALEDRKRLRVGSEVFIDGYLQARSVQRKRICSCCGREYVWKDKAMEIVPYETEYLTNFYTDEELEVLKKQRVDDIRTRLFGGEDVDDEVDEELSTEEEGNGEIQNGKDGATIVIAHKKPK